MKTNAAFLAIPLICAFLLFCAELARSEPALPAPRRDPPPSESSTELEASPVAGQYVKGSPVAPPLLEPLEGAPLLGDEESTDQRFGLLARPWIIRAPLMTRYYLEAKARAGTGLPPYLQEVERAGRSPAELHARLTAPEPGPSRPRSVREPPKDDGPGDIGNGDEGKNDKPTDVW